MSKSKLKKDKNERREELLRPSPHLGYDRDGLGMYLLSRGACEIAESQFRRAVWLNPYEQRFACHLAWCLYRQERYDEAKQIIEDLDAQGLDGNEDIRKMIERIRQKLV